MVRRKSLSIAMVSTHGYVAAAPALGKPDTGGQVVYVLELARNPGRIGYPVDMFTRQLENLPAVEPAAPRVRILRFPSCSTSILAD